MTEAVLPSPSANRRPHPALWMGLAFVVLGVLAFVATRRKESPVPPTLATLPNVTLTDQNGKPYPLQNLQGSVSVVDFIFTSCPDVCPLLTRQMGKLQARAKELGIPVKLASISVDPENDKPAVLKDYATKHGADFGNWTFLTGDMNQIEKVAVDGFKVALDRNASNILDITHTEHFAVVDAKGGIRAYMRAPNNESIDGILTLVRQLETP